MTVLGYRQIGKVTLAATYIHKEIQYLYVKPMNNTIIFVSCFLSVAFLHCMIDKLICVPGSPYYKEFLITFTVISKVNTVHDADTLSAML